MEGNKITKHGKDKLKLSLENAMNERKAILERLEIARGFGDLKENAEYHEAKESLKKIDNEIFQTKNILSNCVVIEESLEKEKVSFGSIVEIENQNTKVIQKYQIVGDAESDITVGLLSELTPLAKAMIGKKTGDIFEVITPRETKKFKILKISI